MTISVSIVSHCHGAMVVSLVQSLLNFDLVSEVIVTLNVPEDFPKMNDTRIRLVRNVSPKGFGENHNAAFMIATSRSFCVLNPDIVLPMDPFPDLLEALDRARVGLVAPIVVDAQGAVEDSVRDFLTPASLIRRFLKIDDKPHLQRTTSTLDMPDWVAGMFMLFSRDAYTQVKGFNEQYFMYCEDADICTRLWRHGFKVVLCSSVSVIHNAQRASHRSLKHLTWHISSICRYLVTQSWRLPSCS